MLDIIILASASGGVKQNNAKSSNFDILAKKTGVLL